MRVVQRSGGRVRAILLCRRVSAPRLTQCDGAGGVLAGEPVGTIEHLDGQRGDSQLSLAAR